MKRKELELSQQLSFHLAEQVISPTVIVSPRRKTVALEIKQGVVRLRVPSKVSVQWLADFIEQRKSWIAKHLKRQQEALDQFLPDPFEKQRCHFLGDEYPVVWDKTSSKSHVVFDTNKLSVYLSLRSKKTPNHLVNEQMRIWLQQQAADYLVKRTHELSFLVGKRPSTVVISNHKTMWGRCSVKGEIALNWRLMLADREAIDYVIIHELCHLYEFNHSAAFWQRVAQYCSNAKQFKEYFKQRASWLHWR